GRILKVFKTSMAGGGQGLAGAWSTDGQNNTGNKKRMGWLWGNEPEQIDKIKGIAWSPDRHRVLTGAYDTNVLLWDVKTSHCIRKLKGHTDTIQCLAWSEDQRRAISGSGDKTLRLWDLETGHCQRVLEGHTDKICC